MLRYSLINCDSVHFRKLGTFRKKIFKRKSKGVERLGMKLVFEKSNTLKEEIKKVSGIDFI